MDNHIILIHLIAIYLGSVVCVTIIEYNLGARILWKWFPVVNSIIPTLMVLTLFIIELKKIIKKK